MKQIHVIIAAMFLFLANQVVAQNELNKEIQVVKPYEPIISDAFKINELPALVDTSKVNIHFNYSIETSPMQVNFEPDPLRSASMVGEPLQKLYNGYLKVGFGNYITPLAEFKINTLRSKSYEAGGYLYHLSSNGKLKNEADKNVFAGYANNLAGAFGRKFFKTSTLYGDISYSHRSIYFYGYNTDSVYNDSILPLSKDQTESRQVHLVNAQFELKTNYLDSSQVNYDLVAQYQYLNPGNKIIENNLFIKTNFNYFFEKQFVGFDGRLDYYQVNGTLDSTNAVVVNFAPWVGAFGKKWQIIAGLNTFYNQEEEKYYFYPRVSLHYNIVDYFLIPYVEFTGRLQVNNYQRMLEENNFIRPDLSVRTTNYNKILSGGLRGNISSKVGFNFNITYSEINNQYFFVNDTISVLNNKFDVVYDDCDLTQVKAEISFKRSEKINFLLKANYYSYNLKVEEKPWHKPDFDVTFTARYQLRDKFVVAADLFALGTRYAKALKTSDLYGSSEVIKLNGTVDMNLSLEYRYTRILSAFIYLNNIGAVRSCQWNMYPTQRFNILAGLTYMF